MASRAAFFRHRHILCPHESSPCIFLHFRVVGTKIFLFPLSSLIRNITVPMLETQ